MWCIPPHQGGPTRGVGGASPEPWGSIPHHGGVSPEPWGSIPRIMGEYPPNHGGVSPEPWGSIPRTMGEYPPNHGGYLPPGPPPTWGGLTIHCLSPNRWESEGLSSPGGYPSPFAPGVTASHHPLPPRGGGVTPAPSPNSGEVTGAVFPFPRPGFPILAFPLLPGGQSINPESLVPRWGRDPPELGRDPPEFLVVSPPLGGVPRGVSPNGGVLPRAMGEYPPTMGVTIHHMALPQPGEGLAIHYPSPYRWESVGTLSFGPPPPRGRAYRTGAPPPCGGGGFPPGRVEPGRMRETWSPPPQLWGGGREVSIPWPSPNPGEACQTSVPPPGGGGVPSRLGEGRE